MIPNIGLTHVTVHLPQRIDDLRIWAKRTGQNDAVVRDLERAGMRYYRNGDGEPAIGLAASAIQRLMQASGVPSNSIDGVIYVHTLQGSVAPPPASLPGLLCHRFGFTNADTFSLAQQHCASALGALRVIRAMFMARPHINRVMLVGADVMPLDTERLVRGEGILSDGAFAALIERNAVVNRLLAVVTHASGDGWRGTLANDGLNMAAQHFLAARSVIQRAAQQANCMVNDIQRILPHHLDLPGWHRLLDSMKLPREKLFDENFARIGHVTVADAFINLADCEDLVPGQPFLLFARGVGGFSAAALFAR